MSSSKLQNVGCAKQNVLICATRGHVFTNISALQAKQNCPRCLEIEQKNQEQKSNSQQTKTLLNTLIKDIKIENIVSNWEQLKSTQTFEERQVIYKDKIVQKGQQYKKQHQLVCEIRLEEN